MFIENKILENKPDRENFYFICEKVSDLPVDNEQENAPFRNPVKPDPKDIGVNHIGNNKNELNKIAIEDLSVEVTALKLFVKDQLHIVKKQLIRSTKKKNQSLVH